jgi:hypothetical protein
MRTHERLAGGWGGTLIHDLTGKISAINKRYAKPTIKLSRGAKLALLGLEIYLTLLVALLAYRFWTIISGGAG